MSDEATAPYPYYQLPLSHAWTALELPRDYDEAARTAAKRILASTGWPEWLTENVGPGDGTAKAFHVLLVEDRDKRRIMVRRHKLYFYEPASAVAAAAKTGTMVEYFISVYVDLYQRWAEKKGLPAPPPVE